MIEREIVEGPGVASDGTVVKSGQIYTRAEAMADIVERLRNPLTGQAFLRPICHEAADEIERLRAALRPFVDWITRNDANYATAGYGDACALTYCPDGNKDAPTVGDLRRARAAYEQTKEVPEMVLVPRRPTEAMVEAAFYSALAEDAKGVWMDMIEAWLQSSKSGNSDK